MCWYAHDYDEIRHKDSDISKFIENVILPKYPKIKDWQIVKPTKKEKESTQWSFSLIKVENWQRENESV